MSDINNNYGIGFPGALFLVFLVLKLLHVINWSWWWVFAPIWISIIFWILLILILLKVFK